MEEKIVDVACAVCITEHAREIARGEIEARAIVVLSKDIDLTPAYESAERRGVALYVAAAPVVDKRPHPYLLLGDRAMSVMSSTTMKPLGHRLRDTVATVAKSRGRATWTVEGYDRDRRAHLVQHPGGALGVLPGQGGSSLAEGSPLELYASGIDFGRGSQPFPYVLCTAAKPKGRLAFAPGGWSVDSLPTRWSSSWRTRRRSAFVAR